MSTRCPGSYGEFAVTITRECFGAKFQILSVRYVNSSLSRVLLFLMPFVKVDIPFCSLALTMIAKQRAHLASGDDQMVAGILQLEPQREQAGDKAVMSFCISSCYVYVHCHYSHLTDLGTIEHSSSTR